MTINKEQQMWKAFEYWIDTHPVLFLFRIGAGWAVGVFTVIEWLSGSTQSALIGVGAFLLSYSLGALAAYPK